MKQPLTDILCTNCGLCCNGSLFDDVELSGEAEATKMEIMGLDVEVDQQALLLQPCAALHGNKCSIYQFRPGCCRTFECRLLQNAKRGNIRVDDAMTTINHTLAHVSRMKELCLRLDPTENNLPLREKCIEALSQPTDCDDDEVNEVRSELAKAMDTMATIVHEEFLGL